MMASRATRGERTEKPTRWIWYVFFAAILVRGGVAGVCLAQFREDPDAYRAIATTLSQSGVFGLTGPDGGTRPTAFRPPLYPYLLSWTTSDVVPVAVLHTLLGAATAVMVFLAAFHAFGDQRVGAFAAAWVIVDPVLLQQSTLVMTETLAVALVSATLYRISVAVRHGFDWKQSVFIGVLLALAYLCRPTFLVWAVLIIAGLLWAGYRRAFSSTRTRWVPSVVVTIIIAGTMGLWMMRNERAVGHPMWATTHGGYTLLLANNPMFYDHLRSERSRQVWDAQSFLDAYDHRYEGDPTTESFWKENWAAAGDPIYPSDTTEVNDDRLCGAAAKALIARQPAMFVWSCFVRVWSLWTPFPHVTPTRSAAATFAIGGYYLAFAGAVLVGLWRWRQSSVPWRTTLFWSIAAMVVTLSAVHAVYWSNLRMRAPAIPGLAIIAGACLYAVDRNRNPEGAKTDVADL
ncbi:hypothetical protein Poly51_04760 [Rubripirellula tenax]|uniref:Glycosyltransferase RgtA/B/C/D-like domain-containing protein n=2 Tax=Rubripirellula tenax TaxID=2528015 RepID=A0A5C6FFC2_9BACT|nr:hypothetical protein Poly51_04760 [Rubripirellula tenax]